VPLERSKPSRPVTEMSRRYKLGRMRLTEFDFSNFAHQCVLIFGHKKAHHITCEYIRGLEEQRVVVPPSELKLRFCVECVFFGTDDPLDEGWCGRFNERAYSWEGACDKFEKRL